MAIVNKDPYPSREHEAQVGAIEDLGTLVQRYLPPIQSLFQAVFFLATVAIVLVIFYALNRSAGHLPMPPRAWLVLALACTVGALPSLFLALPVQFVVRTVGTADRSSIREFLVERITRMGYGDPVAAGRETVFRKVKRRWQS